MATECESLTISWRQGGQKLGEDIRAAKTWLSRDKLRKRVRHRNEREELAREKID